MTGSSVSGMRTLLIAIDAGILMTEEVTRLAGGTPRLIYAASTEPAIVENPDVIVKSVNSWMMSDANEITRARTYFRFSHNFIVLFSEGRVIWWECSRST